jgi:hypothetical protein
MLDFNYLLWGLTVGAAVVWASACTSKFIGSILAKRTRGKSVSQRPAEMESSH